jgi:predicted DNA-binding transcriptional regulator AlpA
MYRWIAQGRFPPPIKLGTYAVAWDSRTIDEWMLQTIESAAEGKAA